MKNYLEKFDKLKWYKHIDVSKSVAARSSIEQIASLSLVDIALNNEEKCVYYYYKEGNTITEPEKLVSKIKELNGRIITTTLGDIKETTNDVNSHAAYLMGHYDAKYWFTWDDAILTLSFDNGWSYLECHSLNKELACKFKIIADEHITEKTQNKVYVFISDMEGPKLKQVNTDAGIALERENYAPDIIEDFDYITRELCSADPSGRLVIISGPPGTGKTYYIRGLTNAIDNAMFVLVQASAISDLMSPQVIPILMEHHNNTQQSIIFIVEDADNILVSREDSNMNEIASLLNLGDGLFGTLFNLKVVATTNARKINIDPALLRNGRCCKYIEIGAIDKEQSNKIYKRLVKDETKSLPEKVSQYVLADIYDIAKNNAQKVQIKPVKENTGFIRNK